MNKQDIFIIENPKILDWHALYTFVRDIYAYMDQRIDPPSSILKMNAADFMLKASNETLVIACKNETLAGCMFCRRDANWLYIGKVAVAEEFQGKGVGRKLFEHAFSIARKRGLKGLELETRIELVENHRVFSRLGFVKTGEKAHAGYKQPTTVHMRAKC